MCIENAGVIRPQPKSNACKVRGSLSGVGKGLLNPAVFAVRPSRPPAFLGCKAGEGRCSLGSNVRLERKRLIPKGGQRRAEARRGSLDGGRVTQQQQQQQLLLRAASGTTRAAFSGGSRGSMSGLDSELEEASGFSDLSDSEFLQIEEPELRIPEKPSCSGSWHPESGSNDTLKGKRSERAKRKRMQTPLETFHLRYLTVTDISAQVWCEQQVVYKREWPDLLLPETSEILNTGKSIHLSRELEDHDLVTVLTTSQEDLWAIKLLNLLRMIPILQSGRRIREVPVFGVLEGVFVVGVIDQLSYTVSGELELSELKTRSKPSMPSAAQKKRDSFQVFLYKFIFDAMVQGRLTQEAFVHHLHLRPDQLLGPHVQEQVLKAGFVAASFQDLLDLLLLNLTLSDIPAIDRLQIEYIHQETSALLGVEVLPYAEADVHSKVQHCIAFWKGQRGPKGVDIEDAWKCRCCAYASICIWRM